MRNARKDRREIPRSELLTTVPERNDEGPVYCIHPSRFESDPAVSFLKQENDDG